MSKSITSGIQALLDDAVAKGVAPGFQCVAFQGDQILYNGTAGLAIAPLPENPKGVPMTPSSILFTASCTKLVTCLIVLHILDGGLSQTGISLADLDNHEALIQVLPELKQGSGSLPTKIIEGFEDGLDADGKKVMKLRDAKEKITLRMLLTHTAGMGFSWNHQLLHELCEPSDGSTPLFQIHSLSGNIRDFMLPLVEEPGSGYHYGVATDWLGLFATRATGKNLRAIYKEFIAGPLGIPDSDADFWTAPEFQALKASVHIKNPQDPKQFVPIPFSVYSFDGEPEPGKHYIAESGLYASAQGYAKLLQAVAKKDTRILRTETWDQVIKDDFKERGLKVTRPHLRTYMPFLAPDLLELSKSTVEGSAVGMNLLQCPVATVPTVSGRPAGSFSWAGIANMYYFVDPTSKIGLVLAAQLLPFVDAAIIELRDKLESLVCKVAKSGAD